jgi:nucleoside-diphosphate-sugar epimerase
MDPLLSSQTIALTGGAGMIASALRPFLQRAGYATRLIDLADPPGPLGANETTWVGSVADAGFMEHALAGADAVIHLGGIHREKPWEQILGTNVTGTYVTLEAARSNGIKKILLASSTHAVGFRPVSEAAQEEALPPRPDTLYGFSKAAMEALGSLYADKYGMKIVCARIGTGGDRPANARSMSTWLSPGDTFRLVEATLNDQGLPGNHIVWAVSNNTRGWANLSAGHRIGFSPQDNAEDFRDSVEPDTGERAPFEDLLGGYWTSVEHVLGVDNYPAPGAAREQARGND